MTRRFDGGIGAVIIVAWVGAVHRDAIEVEDGGGSVGVEMGEVNVVCVACVFMPLKNITASIFIGDCIMDITGIYGLLPQQ